MPREAGLTRAQGCMARRLEEGNRPWCGRFAFQVPWILERPLGLDRMLVACES